MNKRVENKVATTILQRNMTVEVNGVDYEVAPPSTATIILVSECVANFPAIDVSKDENVLTQSLRIAKDCRFLGDIAAIIILGACNLTEKQIIKRRRLFGLLREEEEVLINKKEKLAEQLLNYQTPKALNQLCVNLFSSMELGDFFGLTTFLLDINLMKPTREVETTASGQ